jgi:beta-lactamase class A
MIRFFRRRGRLILAYFIGLTTGLAVYSLVWSLKYSNNTREVSSEKRRGQTEFVNPLLECNNPNTEIENSALKSELETFITKLEQEKNVRISLYFKYYRDASSLSIHPAEAIMPGSLTKVALLMGYLKRAESDSLYLEQEIKFADKNLLGYYEVQGVQPSSRLKLGKTYKIKELLEAAIVRSDNVASVLLELFDHQAMLKQLAIELDVPLHKGAIPHREITIREYASLFKVLFNSAYLNASSSNKALFMLSKSEYRDGIVAGIPSNIRVAHKFGESTDGESHYFNHCGIVYSKSGPYLLCVAAKGKEDRILSEITKDVSALVYKTVVTEI